MQANYILGLSHFCCRALRTYAKQLHVVLVPNSKLLICACGKQLASLLLRVYSLTSNQEDDGTSLWLHDMDHHVLCLLTPRAPRRLALSVELAASNAGHGLEDTQIEMDDENALRMAPSLRVQCSTTFQMSVPVPTRAIRLGYCGLTVTKRHDDPILSWLPMLCSSTNLDRCEMEVHGRAIKVLANIQR